MLVAAFVITFFAGYAVHKHGRAWAWWARWAWHRLLGHHTR